MRHAENVLQTRAYVQFYKRVLRLNNSMYRWNKYKKYKLKVTHQRLDHLDVHSAVRYFNVIKKIILDYIKAQLLAFIRKFRVLDLLFTNS